MRIAQEEIFGPVLAILAHDGEEDAIRIANDSRYGLSGAVFAGDEERAVRVARRIRTGQVDINGGAINPCAPFGASARRARAASSARTGWRSSSTSSRSSAERSRHGEREHVADAAEEQHRGHDEHGDP